jgi:hypothetical protein
MDDGIEMLWKYRDYGNGRFYAGQWGMSFLIKQAFRPFASIDLRFRNCFHN